jgi:hypothetical protein
MCKLFGFWADAFAESAFTRFYAGFSTRHLKEIAKRGMLAITTRPRTTVNAVAAHNAFALG